jgi:cytoskeletal protein CcmA (bactofilin family)
MSEPLLPGSNLTVEDPTLNRSFPAAEGADFVSDTSSDFETWIAQLKPSRGPGSSQQPAPAATPRAAQLKFEGTLWVDTYLAYRLSSETGTLIITESGAVEADILVAVVIIDGRVRGNIRASQRVELQCHARVIGDIESPAVAISPGAVFDGQCRGTMERKREERDKTSI